MTSEAGQAASAHGIGGKPTERSARPGGWVQHYYFEERSDETALRSERIGTRIRDFKPLGGVLVQPRYLQLRDGKRHALSEETLFDPLYCRQEVGVLGARLLRLLRVTPAR